MEQQFRALLDEFRKLPLSVTRPPTFMEVAGYPHHENMCSNILAFFFDPAKPHGLGTLFLDALVSIGGIQNQEGTMSSNVSVDREVSTDARNKIDILIQSDSHVIAIENKIFAGIGNPLHDYARHLDALQPTERLKHKFLLTLTSRIEGTEYGFQNITYGQFVDAIRGLLGHYVTRADTRYLTFMLDFLNTLDHLQVETLMDKAFIDFLASHYDGVKTFLGEVKTFRDELRAKVTRLAALIDVTASSNVHQWPWREGWNLYDYLVHEIKLAPDLPIQVDTYVDPRGWRIQIFVQKGGDRAKLRNLLQRLDIPFEEDEGFTYPTRFKYTAQLEQIYPVVQDIVLKLANSL